MKTLYYILGIITFWTMSIGFLIFILILFWQWNINKRTWIYVLYDYCVTLYKYKTYDTEVKRSLFIYFSSFKDSKSYWVYERLVKKLENDLNKQHPTKYI